jgi:hypothetical protein
VCLQADAAVAHGTSHKALHDGGSRLDLLQRDRACISGEEGGQGAAAGADEGGRWEPSGAGASTPELAIKNRVAVLHIRRSRLHLLQRDRACAGEGGQGTCA